MSDPTPSYTCVTRIWEPYDPVGIQQCLKATQQQFGRLKLGRWYVDMDFGAHDGGIGSRCVANFYFRDWQDAMIFALKYLG